MGADASAGEVARAAREAFLGRDLIAAAPRGWPFGRSARARRARNTALREEAHRRRDQFQAAFATTFPTHARPLSTMRRWRPVERRRNVRVIAGLVGVVAAVFALASWLSSPAPPPAATGMKPPPPDAAATLAPTSAPTSRGSGGSGSAGFAPTLQPIPSVGVAPVEAPVTARVDPATVALRDPPSGEATAAELGSPSSALQAWLERLCPYDYTQPFGTAEQRARSAMTAAGWARLDPNSNDRARQSWAQITAAGESARCSAATAAVSPEAPRSDTAAIVIGQIERVITERDGPAWVDTLTTTRVVARGDDRLWRVDTPSTGG